MVNGVYEVKGNNKPEEIISKSTYTYARYKYRDSKGNICYFITKYISTIDIPYGRYELI